MNKEIIKEFKHVVTEANKRESEEYFQGLVDGYILNVRNTMGDDLANELQNMV